MIATIENQKFHISDDIDFEINWCETGSCLILKQKDGVAIRIENIPPRKIQLLRDRIIDELAKGIMVDPVTKRRKK